MQTKVNYIVFITIVFSLFTSDAFCQDIRNKNISIPIEKQRDTTKTIKNIPITNDTIKNDSKSQKKKQKLEGIISRGAVDYEKLDQKKKQVTLYNKAYFKYLDYELTAGKIVYDYDKKELYAGRIKDSLGNYSQRPVFKQGSQVIEPDSIRFNTETKKAIVWNTRTTYDEFKIKAAKTKKVNDSVYFMKDIIFTTSEDIDNPEYIFKTNKGKFVPGKKVVTGVTNMVIQGVPTPIGLPFAFFPMSEKSISGFIIPSFGDTNLRGYYLQNGGYYFALSENYDLTILGDYYTNGSFALRGTSSYAKRYKYSGNFNISYENLIEGERGLPDYLNAKLYNIQWSHSQDAKANPNSRFSASVNMGSSNYFRQSLNTRNVGANLNNTLSSSISYSKTFQSIPQVNLSLAATHSQNTNTQSVNMSLPTLQLNVDRVFPFAPKSGIKKGFIHNINLQYSLRGENRINTTDSLFMKKEMFSNMNSGMQHSIPLSTNFKIFKYFSVSTSVNYTETWVFNTIKKYYDENTGQVEQRRQNGFDAFRQYNMSANIGTTLYGTFNFSENSRIQAIRHVIRPSVSYSYTPSFEQYYDTYAIDALGTTINEYTRFEQGLFGTPNNQMSNIANLSIGNNLEAKVKDKETDEIKKVMLLNNLNLSTNYNFTADSLKLAPLRLSAGTQLLKDKMQINLGTTLDPYAINNAGQRIDMWNIDNGGSLFRMTSANATVNYSLSSTDALFGGSDSKKNNENPNVMNGGRADDLFGQATDLADRRKSMFGEKDEEQKESKGFYMNSIPWDLTLAYSVTYSNNNRNSEISNNSVMFSGSITPSEGWRVGFSSGYDFKNKGVTYTQIRFERDLKSWRLDLSWVPNGYYKQWNFFIGIKSSILQDIKYEKRNAADRIYR
ncbi:LPS-assembly protein LptD [Paenimyroides tangerinum]|uniref:LPS-assembly protein LptD n=1 Tax=Paenimyroides tangerinum TaxID=2488728 RepID=A0A3P3W8E0_9FLAO|nr:putative LPS assembly protein LptD [Paenimyroides tangerinum]RRJ90964.1 LPS-assembly protein LptD [Paenimyroides tangerinum]